MSNKTQLQTNNTALDALITRVNAAKDTAASLPEASGGGGGSVETCNVDITPRDPSTVSYVNNGRVISETISGATTTRLTVSKNTVLAINLGWSSTSWQSGSCEKLFYTMSCAAYSITGDCVLIGELGPLQ